jgi:hypothetical protein
MTKLTQEQIKTLEDAFNSLPEDMRTGRYRNKEKVNNQKVKNINKKLERL